MAMAWLADLAGIDYQQVSKVENSKVNTTISTANHTALALEVSFWDFSDVVVD
jgi:transcriptional regulator with XRE-family HTH domain